MIGIKNANIINADGRRKADILIEGGQIKKIADKLDFPEGSSVIDAEGRPVIPGGIDPHVHLSLRLANGKLSVDDFDSGSAAALMGGTTTFIDFVHTERREDSLIPAVEARIEEAKSARCDYGLHCAVTAWNESTADEMKTALQKGLSSFKVYLAYKSTIGITDQALIRVMERCAEIGGLLIAHCENGDAIDYLRDRYFAEGKIAPRYHVDTRPPETEASAVYRAITLSGITGAPLYVVHTSTGLGAKLIRETNGRVLGEACLHHLMLDRSVMQSDDFEVADYVMSPPLREHSDPEALWRALNEQSLRCVATDHCAWNRADREIGRNDFRKIPNGVAGLQHRMELFYSEGVLKRGMSMEDFVALTSANAAKIFGLYPRKGVIAEGSDADLLIWDEAKESVISAKTHSHRSDTCVYEGRRVQGGPLLVIAGGEAAVDGGKLLAEKGRGRFLKRTPFRRGIL